MPKIDSFPNPQGAGTIVRWDWDGTERDLRAFIRETGEYGDRASYAVTVTSSDDAVKWYGGVVRSTLVSVKNLQLEVEGLMEQGVEFADQDNYLSDANPPEGVRGTMIGATVF